MLSVENMRLPGVLLLTPPCMKDNRGFFVEKYNRNKFADATYLDVTFVQDCFTFSLHAGTIRGLHYQSPPHAMAKLVSVIAGRIRDVVVDVRRGSPTYGQHLSVELSADNLKQLFVPTGFLHGLVTLEPNTCVAYKMNAYFSPECDGAVLWNDPDLAIDWGLASGANPVISERDAAAQTFANFSSPFEVEVV
jgi:dTDP-4-dehydrorhamnose 3,5-epimerase